MNKILFATLLICLPLLGRAQLHDVDSLDAQSAKKFVDQFWSEWSSPNAVAIPYIQSAIDDPINFYGKSMSRDAYIKAQVAFTKRWPDRQYTVQAGSENINCEQTALTCDVDGIVNWKDFSPERRSISTGSAKFSFSLRYKTVGGRGLYLLTGESGSVISRNVVNSTSDSAIGGITSSQPPFSLPATVSVPYVGCQGSAPWGNVSPPPGHPINLAISPAIAAKLAFYYGMKLFVLAPRGWTCDSGEGEDGSSNLSVRPRDDHGLSGQAVYLENTSSDDNGNFMVTAYGGTYFPNMITSQDVDSVIDQLNQRSGNITKAQFLAPKYPDDRVTYVNGSVLEYRTPPETIGLGIAIGQGLPSNFHLNPDLSKNLSKLPTSGVVGLVKLPDQPDFYFINFLTIRLPPGLAALSPVIQDFTARCQPFDQTAACASQIDFNDDSQQ